VVSDDDFPAILRHTNEFLSGRIGALVQKKIDELRLRQTPMVSVQKSELWFFASDYRIAVAKATGNLAKDLVQAAGSRKGLGKRELNWIEGQARSFSNSKTTPEVASRLFSETYGMFTISDSQKNEDEFVQEVSMATDHPQSMGEARKELGYARALYGKRRPPVVRPRRVEGPPPGKKVADPVSYPTLTVPETRELFGKARSTIYRWLGEKGKLERASLGKQPGKKGSCLILTESARKLLAESAE
jgi:hypothetical protein